ncbi:MAG TPA: hypothetical protein PK961_16160 [bacterium]|nr:hypothetical protein [bacterium]
MKRMILAVLLLVATVALADQILTATVQAPPNADLTLNLSLSVPQTHKVSPEAPLKIEAVAEGAAVAGVPEPFKGKGKQLPYALTIKTAGAGNGVVNVKVSAFACQKDNEGVCQMVNVEAKIPVQLTAGAAVAWDIPLPVKLMIQ